VEILSSRTHQISRRPQTGGEEDEKRRGGGGGGYRPIFLGSAVLVWSVLILVLDLAEPIEEAEAELEAALELAVGPTPGVRDGSFCLGASLGAALDVTFSVTGLGATRLAGAALVDTEERVEPEPTTGLGTTYDDGAAPD
jgi:hypothetical protein